MINVGEELVASYFQYIRGCDFIQKNLPTVDAQGEIDVVGINLKEKKLYIAEVAILSTALQLTYNKRPNNIQKLTEKFSRDIEYAKKYFAGYDRHFMLWSPIVKGGGKRALQYDQLDHLKQLNSNIRSKYKVEIEFVVNERFLSCLNEMRTFVKSKSGELKCPVMRLLQIEDWLTKHVGKDSTLNRQSPGIASLMDAVCTTAKLNSVQIAEVIGAIAKLHAKSNRSVD